jgi:predicted regulator of Ras-like GTPase activity (Roadblock/LC7/MglB family)
MTNQLNLTDLQFSGPSDTDQKLRRLVQDIVAAERAINTLINAIANIPTADVGPFLLANPSLTSTFTVENLAPGEVLQALTATSAAFKKLTIGQLSDVNISGPTDGEVLTYTHGEWVNEPVPAGGGASGVNLGTGQDIYAGLLAGKLAFYSIEGDGSTVTVSLVGETLVLSAATGSGITFAQASAIASIRI